MNLLEGKPGEARRQEFFTNVKVIGIKKADKAGFVA